ncbi:hypothetical protein WJ972_13565 [Achromobacter insuavis]
MSRPSAPSTTPPRPQQPAVPDDADDKSNDVVPDEDIEPADSTADDPRPDDGPVTSSPAGPSDSSDSPSDLPSSSRGSDSDAQGTGARPAVNPRTPMTPLAPTSAPMTSSTAPRRGCRDPLQTRCAMAAVPTRRRRQAGAAPRNIVSFGNKHRRPPASRASWTFLPSFLESFNV